eukprot:CAMPEP_0173101766 /NCGR_PEP_ID=MMETSP1102-20130122/37075_1 /TAXON_ID=49646 /ORGANISM="Geminigera sp., Strain Caron Lab Isolate" /LENGTH=32 /DNA_ID= /DNA_START= /DNA_END= /DNA_ORIENTATION=
MHTHLTQPGDTKVEKVKEKEEEKEEEEGSPKG